MRTYAALSAVTETQQGVILRGANWPNVLISFYYDARQTFIDKLAYDVPNQMLDSGAHSAWSLGKEIDLDKYIEWAKVYVARFPNARITNLDVIPNNHDGLPDKNEIDRAVKGGAENAQAIREAGLRVVEVYHMFEPLEAWEAMIERRQPGEVLGIGGLAANRKTSGHLIEPFGDAAFARLRDMNGGWHNLPPVHAFGVGVQSLAWRYPLSSMDASSWIAPPRYGQRPMRSGKLTRDPKLSHRLRNKEHGVQQAIKLLDHWRKWDATITDFWRSRGVTMEEEGPAVVHEPVAA